MNTPNQQSNTNPDESPTDPKGTQLRQTLEDLIFQKLIDRVKEEDLDAKELRDLLHACCEHKKAEAAEEKTRSTERIAMKRLNKTHPPPPNAPLNPETNPDPNSTNPDPNSTNPTNPDHNGLPLRDSNTPQTQPGALNDPNTNPTAQSHKTFCRNLAKAAMDIWGVDISAVCKANGHYDDDETDPPETDNLYDIPPEYRQGATPISGSQQEYGQPKYTHKEWRRVMFRVIRENYGIYDEEPTPELNNANDEPLTPKPNNPRNEQPTSEPNNAHNKKNQPEAPARTAANHVTKNQQSIPPKAYQPRPPLQHLALF